MSTFIIRRNVKSAFSFIKFNKFQLISTLLLSILSVCVCVGDPLTSVVRETRSLSENFGQSIHIGGSEQNSSRDKMNKLAIFGGTGMTGRCAVAYALSKGKHVKLLVRNEATLPEEFKSKVEVIVGDVLNQADVDKTVEGVDGVVIILGTRNDTSATTVMSQGTKNIIESMKKFGISKFSACMSSFLFMPPEAVPKVFHEINADHLRMLNAVKESGLEYRAVLPPHIADEPSAPFQILYDKSPGRTISKYDLGQFFIDCLDNDEHSGKVIGIATIK